MIYFKGLSKSPISPALLVVTGSLAVAACGGQEISRSETTSLADPTSTVAECMAKFEGGRESWPGKAVRASFVYDASDLEGDKAQQFFGRDPAELGSYYVSITDGDTDAAKKAFLEREVGSDAAMLQAGDLALFSVNYGPAPFDKVLREGCERLDGSVSIIQVTFSQGVL